MKEDGDTEQHIITTSGYFEKLVALGQDLPNNLIAAMLLGSIPESYESIFILVTALESRPKEDFTLKLIKSSCLTSLTLTMR